MIVELFGKRGDGGTSFKSLANYMASVRDVIDPDTGEVIDRRGVTTFTNCLSAETAWIEMWGSSAKSARVEDPVFAGVVSWIPGENPTDEQVRDACLHVLKAEGLEGHQHLIAVHRDTDKVHGHFMANKVHWETGKAAELKWSKMKAVRAA
ncbi:MAG: relaxase/mobilization nuclease domain-containing protein, partial [Streptococcus sp.]|nr:relaxase/mobilization nuclease domain-containing protein [Streptococcus sp.]